ncbi:MAG TPA: hypothetical protein DCM45_02920, partial [Clostridiales bacterium]|nr:hypothetical protein [Clostridiales bacterium]
VLGIQNSGIGYDQILISPEYDIPLIKVEGSYNSIRGKIDLCWEKAGGEILISGSAPANSTAFLRLPDGKRIGLGNGRFAISVATKGDN